MVEVVFGGFYEEGFFHGLSNPGLYLDLEDFDQFSDCVPRKRRERGRKKGERLDERAKTNEGIRRVSSIEESRERETHERRCFLKTS